MREVDPTPKEQSKDVATAHEVMYLNSRMSSGIVEVAYISLGYKIYKSYIKRVDDVTKDTPMRLKLRLMHGNARRQSILVDLHGVPILCDNCGMDGKKFIRSWHFMDQLSPEWEEALRKKYYG